MIPPFYTSKRAGFTLIETMVAITIITLAIAGPLVIANSAIVAARISRDQLTASYLAQEGIEYVRAMRDDNYLAVYNTPNEGSAWSNFLSQLGTGTVSYPAPNLGSTPFTRTVQATMVTDKDEKVVSTVSWSYHGTPYSVTISNHLTPWQ